MMGDLDASRAHTGFNWVDSSLLEGIDQSFPRTFSNAKDCDLQLRRLKQDDELDGDSQAPPYLCSSQITCAEDLAAFAVSDRASRI
jgi:hypothetical protein